MTLDKQGVKDFIMILEDLMDPFSHPCIEGWTRKRVRVIRDHFIEIQKEMDDHANT